MTTHTRITGLVVNGNQRDDAVCVNDTFWGYVVRPSRKAINRAAYGEMTASFAGVLLAMSAYAQWLLPGTIVSPEVLPFKLVGTVVFAVLACFLYLIARRGLCYEVQIDKQRGVLRTARRNRHGSSSQTSSIAFHDINSVFIKRSKAPLSRDQLLIRPGGGLPLIQVAVGRSKELEPILARMVGDLRNGNNLKEPVLERPRTAAKTARARSAFSPRNQTVFR